MKILEQKIGRFGWNVWLVLDIDGDYKIGLVDSVGELYQTYGIYHTEEIARFFWGKA